MVDANIYQVRIAEASDSYRIWEIRNNHLLRKNFRNPQPILLEEHELWFENQYFISKKNFCYVIVRDNNYVIGYCRLDYDSNRRLYVLSIAIEPDSQGKGLGDTLLLRVLDLFKQNEKILAEIKKDNYASVNLFTKHKFLLKKQDNDYYYLER